MAFLLMFLFLYSAMSLLSLFTGWLVFSGTTLHLLFLASSEDDYHSKFKGAKGAEKTSIVAKQLPLEERDEFIAPRTIFSAVLALYRVALSVLLEYRNLERARNIKLTAWFLGILPLAIVGIYWLGISDLFFGWLFTNYVVLQPAWPAIKSAIVVPKPVLGALETAKRVLVPRFLR